MSERYYGRKRAYGSFAADIEDFIQVSEKRMTALMRKSISDVIDNAQTRTDKGGRMRVDTGFLRASGQVSLNGMPTGPLRPMKDGPDNYTYNETTVETNLGKIKFGNTVFFGWTAEYARYRELYDGFLEGALTHWARIVAFNTDEIKRRITK